MSIKVYAGSTGSGGVFGAGRPCVGEAEGARRRKNHFAACVLHKFHIRRPVTQRLALSPARPPPQPENHPPARCLPPDLIGFRNKNDRFPVTAPHVPPLGT